MSTLVTPFQGCFDWQSIFREYDAQIYLSSPETGAETPSLLGLKFIDLL